MSAKERALKSAVKILWLLVLGLSSCKKAHNDFFALDQKQVSAVIVKSREINGEIRGFGSLSFKKKVDIAAPADAVLKSLLKREGDFVREGDIVSILTNPQITLSVERAESAYSHALAARDIALARLGEGVLSVEARLLENEKMQTEFVQAQRSFSEQRRKHESEEALFAAGGISEESIRDSRFKIETAEVQLALLKKEIEIRRVGFRESDLLAAGIDLPEDENEQREALIYLATAGLRAEAKASEANLEAAERELQAGRLLESSLVVRSPMTGIVGVRYFEEGERLAREDKIFTIMDTNTLYAVFPVPEAEALKIARGMPASVGLDGTGGTYNGVVDLVSPQADSQSLTFLVRVIMDTDGNNVLKPGMFARVTVPLEQFRTITLVPESSVVDKKDDKGRVYILQNNVVSERVVRLGQLFGDEREIVSGIASGEVVVLLPDPSLEDGTYVSVVN